jgi:hypothetical protein
VAFVEGRKTVRDAKKAFAKNASSPRLDGAYVLVEKMLLQTREKTKEFSNRGVLDQNIVAIVNEVIATTVENYQHLKVQVEESFKQRVYAECYSLRVLVSQLMRSLNALSVQQDRSEYSSIYEVLVIRYRTKLVS